MVLGQILILLIAGCRGDSDLMDIEEVNSPLPAFLNFAVPKPQSSLSLSQFQAGEHYPLTAHPVKDDGASRICIKLMPQPLLEAGDMFSARPNNGDFLPDRVNLLLDEELESRRDEVITILSLYYLRKDTKVIAEAPGPQIICWLVTIEPGIHVAAIEVERTSGYIEAYYWTFEITE